MKSIARELLRLTGLWGVASEIIRSRSLKRRNRLYKQLVDFYFKFNPQESNANFESHRDELLKQASRNRYENHTALFVVSVVSPCLSDKPSTDVDILERINEFYGPALSQDLLASFKCLGVDIQHSWKRISGAKGTEALDQAIKNLVQTLSVDEKRLAVVKILIQVILDDGRVPRFFEINHIENLEGTIKGLYPTHTGVMRELSDNLLSALSLLTSNDAALSGSALPARLYRLGVHGEDFKPITNAFANPYVHQVMPEKYDGFGDVLSANRSDELLAFNREYSERQFLRQGKWDNRDVSLLRGYEQDHHLLLRTIISLMKEGKLVKDDRVLVVGPRHIDEINFFRSILGLKNTIGLDLFDVDGFIVSGDMHDMAFRSNEFKLIYSAGTVAYSYDVRKVFKEMVRVLQKPGYLMITDSMSRKNGLDPLGRSDIVDCDVAIGMFHEYRYRVVAKDNGKPLNLNTHLTQPSFCIEITGSV